MGENKILTTHKFTKYKNDIKWEEKFNLLKEYKEEFGDCNAPDSVIYKGVKLGIWCNNQRQAFKANSKSIMNQERIDKLNSIGFIWNPLEYEWNKNFNLLKEYKEEFGNCDIPYYYRYKNSKLGVWVSTQRSFFNKSILSNDKINRLNSIGFIWNTFEYEWENNFNLLKEYKERYGDCNVPQNFIYKEVKLGDWVSRQRSFFNKSVLSNDKIDKLNSIGFIWDPLDKQWENNFNLLKEYKEEFGDCNVPQNFIYKEVKLGVWVNNQRQGYKKTGNRIISQERIDKLNSIGFKW